MTDTAQSRWQDAVAKKNLPCHCDQHLRDAGLPRPGTGKFGWKPSNVAVRGAVKKRSLRDQSAASEATVRPIEPPFDLDVEADLKRAAEELGVDLDGVRAAA